MKWKNKRHLINYLPGFKYTVLQHNQRSVSKKLDILGHCYFQKSFLSNDVGRTCFKRELQAHTLFKDCLWMPPLLWKGRKYLIRPFYPSEMRLDRIAIHLDAATQLEIARQAIGIIFDIFLAGYAHRDFHTANLFWVDNQLKVVDFEVLYRYPEGSRPPFPISYDLTGRGLDSPFKTHNMGYLANNVQNKALSQVLRIPLAELLTALEAELKAELVLACKTFQSEKQRHQCRVHRIYSSFTLPYFSVSPDVAQRNSARRLTKFGIVAQHLKGKRILDLGSNIGGMLFEAQKFQPGECVGVEYDKSKVDIARKIAAYNGLNNITFYQNDIDTLLVKDMKGPYDVTFCLAIDAHVKDRERLYHFLTKVTSETLYFEGNSSTDIEAVQSILSNSGFQEVALLGTSDDDIVADNNCRPLLVARK